VIRRPRRNSKKVENMSMAFTFVFAFAFAFS